jgi:hypothetical protein
MDKPIEYEGTPEEWKKLNSRFQLPQYSTAKRKRVPYEKRYRLTYGNQTILPSASFDKCIARKEFLLRTEKLNYSLQQFKITENGKN